MKVHIHGIAYGSCWGKPIAFPISYASRVHGIAYGWIEWPSRSEMLVGVTYEYCSEDDS